MTSFLEDVEPGVNAAIHDLEAAYMLLCAIGPVLRDGSDATLPPKSLILDSLKRLRFVSGFCQKIMESPPWLP